MWNMSEKGFKELYEKLPGRKPKFKEVWGLTGGNPEMLARPYQDDWNVDAVVAELIKAKELTRDLVKRWEPYLKEVVEDPQSLWEEDYPSEFREELIAKNLVVYNMYDRPHILDRRAAARKGPGARDWKRSGLADTAAQRGRQEGDC